MQATNRRRALPLEGVKIVELSHLIAGPYAGMLLAGEGAEVIKIEAPGGELSRSREPFRATGEHRLSAHYAACNRGKKSLVLDLKNTAGIATLGRLLEDADVFLTNMRGGALERLGIHPNTLRREFPRLVIASISGFGLENAGEFEDRAGLAMVAEALSGSMGLTRDDAGNPVWCGFALGDIAAAMTAHSAILLALRTQERDGEGQILDLTLTEASLPMVCIAMARIQVASREFVEAAGSNSYHGVPFGAFPASDGFITLGVNNDTFWRRFCEAMGRPELGTDERYAKYVNRSRNRVEVHAITAEFTRRHTRQELTDMLREADVPIASVLSMEEVLASDYFRGRRALREVEDGMGGRIVLPSDATRQEDLDAVSTVPLLGQHRDEVLGGHLGMPMHEIEALARCGAFG